MIDMVWVGRRSAQKMAEKRLGKSWVLETNRGKVVSECRHDLFAATTHRHFVDDRGTPLTIPFGSGRSANTGAFFLSICIVPDWASIDVSASGRCGLFKGTKINAFAIHTACPFVTATARTFASTTTTVGCITLLQGVSPAQSGLGCDPFVTNAGIHPPTLVGTTRRREHTATHRHFVDNGGTPLAIPSSFMSGTNDGTFFLCVCIVPNGTGWDIFGICFCYERNCQGGQKEKYCTKENFLHVISLI